MNVEILRLKEILGDKLFAKAIDDVVGLLRFNKEFIETEFHNYPNQKALTAVAYTIGYKFERNDENKKEILTKIFTLTK